MAPSKQKRSFKSFRELRDLTDRLPVKPTPENQRLIPRRGSRGCRPLPEPESERQLFCRAMADVTPLAFNRHPPSAGTGEPPARDHGDSGDDTLHRLDRLVRTGRGFKVSDTPEYIEGTGYLAPPRITQKLHRGEFSVQDHLDLHGHTAASAEKVFNTFMHQIIRDGKRCVLIIHGRGRSSPERPVLKSRVIEWLSSTRWRKWIVAYASANRHDGGAGGTYVLLRRRPVAKKHRK